MERHHIVNCYRNAPADSSSRRAADTRFVEDDEDTMASCNDRSQLQVFGSCAKPDGAGGRANEMPGSLLAARDALKGREAVLCACTLRTGGSLTAWRFFRPSGSTRDPRTSWLPGPSLKEAPRIPLLEISRLRRLSVSSFKHHNPRHRPTHCSLPPA